MNNESQIANRREEIRDYILLCQMIIVLRRAMEHHIVVGYQADPENIETNHLDRDEVRDLFTVAPTKYVEC